MGAWAGPAGSVRAAVRDGPKLPHCAVIQVHTPSAARSGRPFRPARPVGRAMRMHPASSTPFQVGICLNTCSRAVLHVPGRACWPVLFPGRAVLPPHHPCRQIGPASQLSAMQVLTASAVWQAGHAGQPCSHAGAPCSPSSCARQPCCLLVQPPGCTMHPQVHEGTPAAIAATVLSHTGTNPHDAARQQWAAHLRTRRPGSRCWRKGQAALQEPGQEAPEEGLLACLWGAGGLWC